MKRLRAVLLSHKKNETSSAKKAIESKSMKNIFFLFIACGACGFSEFHGIPTLINYLIGL